MNKELMIVVDVVGWLNKELAKVPSAFNELFTHYVDIPIDTDTLIVCGKTDDSTANFGVMGLLNGLVNARVTPHYRICAIVCPVGGLAYFDVFDVKSGKGMGIGEKN